MSQGYCPLTFSQVAYPSQPCISLFICTGFEATLACRQQDNGEYARIDQVPLTLTQPFSGLSAAPSPSACPWQPSPFVLPWLLLAANPHANRTLTLTLPLLHLLLPYSGLSAAPSPSPSPWQPSPFVLHWLLLAANPHPNRTLTLTLPPLHLQYRSLQARCQWNA